MRIVASTGGLVRGVYFDADRQETSALWGSGCELIKTSAKIGAIGFGAAVLFVLLAALQQNGQPAVDWKKRLNPHSIRTPLGGIDYVQTHHAEFFGVCLDEEVEIRAGHDLMRAPYRRISRIGWGEMGWEHYCHVESVEGSLFKCVSFERPVRFATVMGELSVKHIKSIDGLMPRQIEDLASRLNQTLLQSQVVLNAEQRKTIEAWFGATAAEPPDDLIDILCT